MERTFLEKLRKFTQYGAIVGVKDSMGTPRQIRDAEPDTWELAESAEEFRVEGKWHKRADFEKLMDKRMQPSNVSQIPLPPVNLIVLALVFAVQTFAADKPPDPDVIRAVKDAKILRSVMRNPDSFVLERVFMPVGDKTGGLCFDYRSQNGYGGMSHGVALFGKAQTVTLPSNGDAPNLSFTPDDPYLLERSHDVCEGVSVMRDLTKETLAALEAENAESKSEKTASPKKVKGQ